MTVDKEISNGKANAGCLYLVSTPIGNLADISKRAIDILKTCDLIACEDTRVSGKLLAYYDIDKSMIAYHEHNEDKQTLLLVDKLKSGLSIALISDAGTPSLNDPGFRVVRECRRENIPVIPIPGASAILATLAASGMPVHRFLYAGFLPAKKAARRKFFEEHKADAFTLILYESRYRIVKFMDDLLEVLGPDRQVCIGREITKMHETFIIGKASEVREQLKGSNLKGEFVVIIASEGFVL